MSKFQVILYTEVDKNDQDMWYAASVTPTDIFTQLETDDLDLKKVFTDLKSEGILDTADKKKVTAIVGTDVIQIYEKKGMKPICRLERRRV